MLFEFITSVAEFITGIIGMIANFFYTLILLIASLPRILAYITNVIGVLPPFVFSAVTISIAIAVIITLVNHWGS